MARTGASDDCLIFFREARMSREVVCQALTATLSPDAATRGQAESYLNECRRTAGFATLLLDLARPRCRNIQRMSTRGGLPDAAARLVS
jgi:hypothetical protein